MGPFGVFTLCVFTDVFGPSHLPLQDLIGCFLFGLSLSTVCNQADGESEEEPESVDTGEEEEGGDESDLVTPARRVVPDRQGHGVPQLVWGLGGQAAVTALSAE